MFTDITNAVIVHQESCSSPEPMQINPAFDYLTRIIAQPLSFARTHCEEDV